MTMPQPASKTDLARAGTRIYSDFTLRFYDLVVLQLSSRFIWHCSSAQILDFYNAHISTNHLDVGVGTGYFLNKCQFPTDKPRIGLMDLNVTSLKVTAKRLQRYQPTVFVANVLEPVDVAASSYDSIGLSYLLHCLPGTMQDKAVVFDNLNPLLKPNGVVFGTTLLGENISRGWPARLLMRFYNQIGAFSNAHDNLADLDHILKANFSTYSLYTVGCVALFAGQI